MVSFFEGGSSLYGIIVLIIVVILIIVLLKFLFAVIAIGPLAIYDNSHEDTIKNLLLFYNSK